jgi:hypothetical protein
MTPGELLVAAEAIVAMRRLNVSYRRRYTVALLLAGAAALVCLGLIIAGNRIVKDAYVVNNVLSNTAGAPLQTGTTKTINKVVFGLLASEGLDFLSSLTALTVSDAGGGAHYYILDGYDLVNTSYVTFHARSGAALVADATNPHVTEPDGSEYTPTATTSTSVGSFLCSSSCA